MLWRFEQFVFDTERRELLRDSEPVHLTPQGFRLLEILIANAPRAVSQEDIHDGIWTETIRPHKPSR